MQTDMEVDLSEAGTQLKSKAGDSPFDAMGPARTREIHREGRRRPGALAARMPSGLLPGTIGGPSTFGTLALSDDFSPLLLAWAPPRVQVGGTNRKRCEVSAPSQRRVRSISGSSHTALSDGEILPSINCRGGSLLLTLRMHFLSSLYVGPSTQMLLFLRSRFAEMAARWQVAQ